MMQTKGESDKIDQVFVLVARGFLQFARVFSRRKRCHPAREKGKNGSLRAVVDVKNFFQ
ncbi:hypothetical protein P4479_22425 [Brevibacillus agri]|uniref:hypothetical protein n=2 Tax=Brevibacillus agri TaxID=51101 RepID=UPI002E1DB51B|nr:hypothetical protein [Brevibacillus agri]